MMKFGKLRTLGIYNHAESGEVMILDYYPIGEHPVFGDEKNDAERSNPLAEPHYKVQQTSGLRQYSYIPESELIEIPTNKKFIANTWDAETKRYSAPLRKEDGSVWYFDTKQELNDHILESGISCAIDEVDINTVVEEVEENEEE